MNRTTDDLRIKKITKVISPEKLQQQYPVTDVASHTIYDAREATHHILHGEDDRLLVVVGPCSIHDPEAALEYAKKLQVLRTELSDQLHIVMRVYFEKPRTSIGWKGLINDSDLQGNFDINKGLGVARKLLVDLADIGMPAATEYLDLISPQYIADLISWAAIGARTTESQGHRELASGVSCPIGFKNGTNGNIDIAINAIEASSQAHHFLSVTKKAQTAIFETGGNNDCHIILRGGTGCTNYDVKSIADATEQLAKSGFPARLMVDFSHANSEKDYNKQMLVGADIAKQVMIGSQSIFGVMIESHLVEGKQNADGKAKQDLVYGQSITDACIGWDATNDLLRMLAMAVDARRNK
ncbi:MAG: 3-deoxy-7-phosphoheptulonate synthase [Cocleimonas sp.]|nr:3-deoxy-7-phosphoheptulonate synthase [Cocleimonas sp.]